MTKKQNIIRLLLVDDHQVVLDGIKFIFEKVDDVNIIGEAHNGQEALDFLISNEVHVVLLDLNMPVLNGLETCKLITEKYPDIKIVGFSMLGDLPLIKKLIKNGAKGYLLKNSGKEEIIDAIRTVAMGKTFFDSEVLDAILKEKKTFKSTSTPTSLFPDLSKREKEIVKLILKEHTTNEIAELLFISFGTVETHRRNIINKLGVRNTAGMIRVVMEYGLID